MESGRCIDHTKIRIGVAAYQQRARTRSWKRIAVDGAPCRNESIYINNIGIAVVEEFPTEINLRFGTGADKNSGENNQRSVKKSFQQNHNGVRVDAGTCGKTQY